MRLYAIANEMATRQPDGSTGIFLPFGTWPYGRKDGREVTQTFDEASAEAVANELAAAVARGEPGVPVYQGHPDVPELAHKYPDKSAIGWVKAWERTKEGLRAVVEWLRDPGRGFGWHSPYWFGTLRPAAAGCANCHVEHLQSIGLVNNPNIRDFRLANEAQPEQQENTQMDREKLIQMLGLANITDANGMEHVDKGSPEGGQFAPKEGAADGTAVGKYYKDKQWLRRTMIGRVTRGTSWGDRPKVAGNLNALLRERRRGYTLASQAQKAVDDPRSVHYKKDANELRGRRRLIHVEMSELHKIAILRGLTYNPGTREYE